MRIFRAFVLAIAALAGSAFHAWAQGGPQSGSQTWPSRPIHFIVPFPAGGATDVLTRLLCEQLAIELKVPCLVDNRGGAGGNIGGAAVAASQPDGYTYLMSAPGVLAYNKILYRDMPFDPDKDLDPISLFAIQPNVLVVNPSVPAHSVAELIAYAKANPRKLDYGSGGVGSTSHVATELFKTMAGVDMQHVPYRGTGPELIDLMAGRVQLVIDNLPAILPHIKSGELRALAISTATRSPLLPELPTIAESGLPGFAAASWQMVAAPTGTPPAILDSMSAAIKKITADPKFRARLAELGVEALGSTVDEARSYVKQEAVKWREVVIRSGAKAD
jgi:tripartite-type tricarboxylate transporter receptor subunit TctC